MLRMGRGPKTETARDDRQSQPNNAPQTNTTPPQTFAPPPAPVAAPVTPQPAATQAQGSAPARALTESDALARDIREGIVGGFVGKNADLKGEANFKGMLRVDGRLSGTVNSEDGTLIVSAGGVVEANIKVATARINGTVNGDINATKRVEFGRNAQVRGDIRTPSLVIEDGAIFEGNCRMSTTAQTEKVEAKERVEAKTRPARQAVSAQTTPPLPAERAEPSSVNMNKAAV